MANREALRRARELREEFRETGTVFTQEDFAAVLRERLEDLADEAFDDLVENVAARVDQASTRERPDEDTQPCLPGLDLVGEYKLGGGRRVAKKHAQLMHAHESLAIAQQNVTAVMEALTRRHEELQRLIPHWGPGVTKAQAVTSYLAAHPDQALPEGNDEAS